MRNAKNTIPVNRNLNEYRKFVKLVNNAAIRVISAALKIKKDWIKKNHIMICPKAIITTDEADDQKMHRDCLDKGNFTVVVALTQRKIEFEIGGEIK